MNLRETPIPEGAQERAWHVVSQAFSERSAGTHRRPVPSRLRLGLVAASAAAALAAAAVSASGSGSSVVHSVRRALGVDNAAPALVRLPAAGKLLVNGSRGSWVVAEDGAKRRVGRYGETSWSPHGLYLAASRGHELAAVDPRGNVRWSIERGPIHGARWSSDGYRIAYISGGNLRVIAGDGTGDHLLARSVAATAPAWSRSGPAHELLYSDRAGRLHLVDADTGTSRWVSRPGAVPSAVGFDAGGRVVVALTARTLRVLHARDGGLVKAVELGGGAHLLALSPAGPAALTTQLPSGQTAIALVHPEHPSLPLRPVFRGQGRFSDIAWSPDGRWLLAAWSSADQWVFVELAVGSGAARQVRAVASIASEFHDRGALTLGGWCCRGGLPAS